MKLLFDANLSWKLVKILEKQFRDSSHVDSVISKLPASDIEIWEFAKSNDFTIVTNDDDFYQLSVYKGSPPKIVMLRFGNQRTRYIAEVLIKHQKDIVQMVDSNDYGVLEIY
ncbi:MAG: hypothetical protein COX07_02340 [Bacteroidetes bacterium CG23_combo_of_CG06-09_8_20_14_all_32_9]|nr:MAG: hypothetical protein COX07_02340 [Bacteroidetes bacterium CG23_combo_of_CG06-09_8_20_14_all_32_9]